MPDESIAAMLNRSGRYTGKGRRWRKAGVASFRAYRKIPTYREGEEKERGELGAREAARILGVCERTVISRIASGKLPALAGVQGRPLGDQGRRSLPGAGSGAAVPVRCRVR